MPSWGSSPVQPSLLRPQASLHPADTSQEEAWCAALHSKWPLETTGPWGVRCAMPFSRLNHFSSHWSPFCYRIFLNPLFPSTTRAQPSLMSLGPGTTRPSRSCPPVPTTFHVAVASGRPHPALGNKTPHYFRGLPIVSFNSEHWKWEHLFFCFCWLQLFLAWAPWGSGM